MVHDAVEAERLIRCFDPDVSLTAGASEHLVISPRWGRLRRSHPLLGSSPSCHETGCAWQAARENLLCSRDRAIQLALATYEYRVRIRTRVPVEVLKHPHFHLHGHCHALLDQSGQEKNAVVLRREAFWIRSLPPDPDGVPQFEFGNTFLAPIAPAAVLAEAKSMFGKESCYRA